MLDRERLDRTLGTPELSRLVRRLVHRIELGTPLTGRLVLANATEGERRALGRLGGMYATASIDLGFLEDAMRESGVAPSLEAAVQALMGPVVPRSVGRAAEQTARDQAVAVLHDCVHAAEPWFAEWAATLPVTRLVRAGTAELIGQAVAVLNRLPATSLPLSVLAERATGDTKALLPEEPLGRQVLRALALRSGIRPAKDQEARRALWASVGVLVDDLASQVLVLNVPSRGGMVASWLNDAAAVGLPFRLTLQQLTLHPVTPQVTEVYVCENPAVLRAAAA